MYHASYCNVCINQQNAQILVNNLCFSVNRLYMFRAIISSSSGATFNKLYSAIGTFVPVSLAAVWTGPSYTHTAARCTSTNVPTALYSLLNVALDDGLMIVQNMYS